MRIAISSTGPDVTSKVDPRFGRARFFVVVDTENDSAVAIDNTGVAQRPQGAGIKAAESLTSQHPDVVLTGHCGPKAFAALQAAGVKVVVGASGTVQEAVDRFTHGEMTFAVRPNVEGHWA